MKRFDQGDGDDRNGHNDHTDDDSKKGKYQRRGHNVASSDLPLIPRWRAHLAFFLVSVMLLYVVNERRVRDRRGFYDPRWFPDGDAESQELSAVPKDTRNNNNNNYHYYENTWNPDYPICFRQRDNHTVTLQEIEPLLERHPFLVKRYERMKWDFFFALQYRRWSLNQTRLDMVSQCKPNTYLVFLPAATEKCLDTTEGDHIQWVWMDVGGLLL